MSLAAAKQAPVAERVCRCRKPLVQTRATTKWAHEHYCARCGLLAPLAFRR